MGNRRVAKPRKGKKLRLDARPSGKAVDQKQAMHDWVQQIKPVDNQYAAIKQNYPADEGPYKNPLLNQREHTHGDFGDVSGFSQRLKAFLRREYGWDRLDSRQQEALEMIALKMVRIIKGNPRKKEHWDDIAGYANLVSERSYE